MPQKILKPFRLVFSISFFILLLFIFVDFKAFIPPGWSKSFLFFQFIPSIIHFLSFINLAGIGFIIVLLLSLLFGRAYCSFLCPLGVMQDIAGFFRRIKKKWRVFRYRKPNPIFWYSILVATLVSAFAGSLVMINLLDPFSNIGRIFTNLFKPIYLILNNLLADMAGWFGSYHFVKNSIPTHPPISYLFPLFVLISISLLAFFRGRWYCNTICPVGALLGLISKFSWLKIKLDAKACTHCGACSSNCKAECIDLKELSISYDRCVSCYNCLDVCKDNAAGFEWDLPKLFRNKNGSLVKTEAIEINTPVTKTSRKPINDRRAFFGSVMMLGIAGVGQSCLRLEDNFEGSSTTIPENKEFPVTPPGAISQAYFTARCTACHLCISECPTGVLQPAFREYGLAGLMQARMDFRSNYCNFDCILCMEICPSGALKPLSIAEKKSTQIGKVIFIRESCIVVTDEKDCGACSEHCPTKAVDMVPYKGSIKIPEIDTSLCVGCGACEYACPTRPFRAIYIEGNPVHLVARPPIETDDQTPILEEDEFPF